MITFKFYFVPIAALIPLIVGFIWYNPKVFGNAWMKASGTPPPEEGKRPKMALTFILTYVFSFLISFMMISMVIHQISVFSILANEPGMQDPNSEIGRWFTDFMTKYGTNFRTFKHGMFHGFLNGLLFVTPIIAINAMFERRKFKYIAINGGYWIVSMMLMGGLICQFL